MTMGAERIGERFDPTAPEFLVDPYPTLESLREASPFFWHEGLDRRCVTQHADVRACALA